MDALTRQIGEYAHGLKFSDIPPSIIQAAKRRMLDSIGCALGGRDCEAVRVGRRLAENGPPDLSPGRVLGSTERTTIESAATLNMVMIRHLDFADAYHSSQPGVFLGSLLAMAESAGADGRRLLSGVVVGYEVMMRITDATRDGERGWDQGIAADIGLAAAAGHVLGLSAEQISNGVAITAVANVQLRATKKVISQSEGAAAAYAGRNAVFAVLMAAKGMTSPDDPFDGHLGLGLFDQMPYITGSFDVAPFATKEDEFLLPNTKLKYWPVDGSNQAAVWAAMDIREEMAAEDIDDIDIATYEHAWHTTACEPEQWDPQTRNVADHSMPYIFARALRHGPVRVDVLDPENIADASIRPLMQKIRVHLDDELEAAYQATDPYTITMRVVATDNKGNKKHVEVINPPGFPQTPLTDDNIRSKFHGLADPLLGEGKAKAAADAWFDIDNAKSLTPALDMLLVE